MKKILPILVIVLFCLTSIIPMVHSIHINKVEGKVSQGLDFEQDEGGLMDSAWPMFAHDNRHTGRSPYGTPGNTPVVGWKCRMEGRTHSSPAIDKNGTVYIGVDDFQESFYAISNDGTEKWHFGTGNYIFSSPAIGADGIIYVGSNSCHINAIYPNNGSFKWRFGTGAWVQSSPAIGDDGTIYVGCINSNFHAINPNGTEKWRFRTNGDIRSSPAIDENGIIYIGSHDTYLYALYPNGTLKWKFKAVRQIKSPPAIGDDGTIYFGSWDGTIYAVNPDGTLRWKYYIDSQIETSPAIALDGTIYAGTYDGRIFAMNPDGTMKWEFQTGDTIYSSPAIDKYGTIYCGSWDGNLYALNPDGSLKWVFSESDNIISSPAIDENGTIYFGGNFQRETGIFSYLYALEIIEDEPPDIPTVNGKKIGYRGREYYLDVSSIEPDGGQVAYYIDWDVKSPLEWSEYYDSGEKVTFTYTWGDYGSETIKVKAKNTLGAESDWAYFEVLVLKNRAAYSNTLFYRLLEQFPLLQKILLFLTI